MTDLLAYKERRLRQLEKCPLCGQRRQGYWCSEEFDAVGNQEVFRASHLNDYVPGPPHKAAARFKCGLTLAIGTLDDVIAPTRCSSASDETARELDREIEGDFEDQEENNDYASL